MRTGAFRIDYSDIKTTAKAVKSISSEFWRVLNPVFCTLCIWNRKVYSDKREGGLFADRYRRNKDHVICTAL
jgi:hypothetical protein